MRKTVLVLCLIIILAAQPVLGAWADLNVWVDDVMVKYRQDGEDGTSGSNTLTLYCAKNEFEPFQVLVYNSGTTTETINDVTVTQTAGPGTIDDIYIYRMHYINASIPSRAEYETGFYPDPLVPKVDRYYHETRDGAAGWPPTGIPVDPGKVQGFWVDLGTTPNTPAGTYTFSVAVQQNGQTDKTMTVTLEVWDFEIPSTSTLKTQFGITPFQLDNDHGVSYGLGNNIADLTALYMKSFLYHRMAPTTTHSSMSIVSGGVVSDWRYWDRAYGNAMGGTAISSGPYAGARLSCIDIERSRELGSLDSSHAAWVVYLQSWWDKFSGEGWDPMNTLFAYTIDEPGAWPSNNPYRGGSYSGYQIALLKASSMCDVNTGGQGAWKNSFVTAARRPVLYDPGAGYESFDDTGIYCPVMRTFADMSMYPYECHPPDYTTPRDSYPGETWSYISCMSHGCGISGSGACYDNKPDIMIDSPPLYLRGVIWISWHYDFDCFLYFMVNEIYKCHRDSWYDVYCFGGNGDGQLIFPGVPDVSVRNAYNHTPSIGGTNDIPIESVRMKLLREGLEDYEYMQILMNINGDGATVDAYVNTIFTSVVGAPGAYYNLRTDPSYIDNARYNIALQILESGSCTSDDDCAGNRICCNEVCVNPVCMVDDDCKESPDNVCTDNICNGEGCSASCSMSYNNNACDDGVGCTVGDSCQAGSCQPGTLTDALCTARPECGVATCTVSGCVYSDCPIPADMVLWLPFDNNLQDASGNGNHGSCSGSGCPVFVAGHDGQAVDFDGVDDYIDCGNDASLSITGDLTVAAWINPRSLNDPQGIGRTLLTKWQGSEFDFTFWNYLYYGHNSFFDGFSYSFSTNTWQHIAVTRDSSTLRLYVDGELRYSLSYTGSPSSSSYAFLIGKRNTEASYFDGLIDDVRVYNRALSDSEIQDLYEGSPATGICGDDTCNPGETCNACPQDCIVGDVDGNCNVGLSDLIIVAGNFGCTSNCGDSDIDRNNQVNILDLILVGKNFT